MAGGVVSTTVTVAVQDAVAPSLSTQVSMTGCGPTPEYGGGGACVQPTRLPSGSNEPSSTEASAAQTPSAITVRSAQRASGGRFVIFAIHVNVASSWRLLIVA